MIENNINRTSENSTISSKTQIDTQYNDNSLKSTAVLSFDVYGNLTSDDQNISYNHDIPSLDEFDYILDGFDPRLKSQDAGLESSLACAVLQKKNKTHKKVKLDSQTVGSSFDDNLEQAFKAEFSAGAAAPSRYGRARKQKAAGDGFLIGTINFNQLRKITSSSPKKSSGKKSNAERVSLVASAVDISQTFKVLANKIPGFSSEDEFDLKDTRSSKRIKMDNEKSIRNTKLQLQTRGLDVCRCKNNKVRRNAVAKKADITKAKCRVKRKFKSLDSGSVRITRSHVICNDTSRIKGESELHYTFDSRMKENFDFALSDTFDCSFDTKGNNSTVDFLSPNNKILQDAISEAEQTPFITSKCGSSLIDIVTIEDDDSNIKNAVVFSSKEDRINLKYEDKENVEDLSPQTAMVIHTTDSIAKCEDQLNIELLPQDNLNINAEDRIVNYKDNREKTEVPVQDDVDIFEAVRVDAELILKKEEPEPEIISMETLVEDIKNDILMLTKSGRQVKKPELMDMSTEARKEKEAREKQKHIKQEVAVIEEDFLETADFDDKNFEKDFPCHYYTGDLVWVSLRGSPLWPGIITNPNDDSSYTKICQSPKSKKLLKNPRLYHIKFLCDNAKVYWANSTNIIIFEGLTKLRLYLEQLKVKLKEKKPKQNIKLCIESAMKTLGMLHRKTLSQKCERWYQAIQEGEVLLKLDRYCRICKLIEDEEQEAGLNEKKIRKSRMPKSLNTDGSKQLNKLSKMNDEEFSGFEENSSVEMKKCKGKKVLDLMKQESMQIKLQACSQALSCKKARKKHVYRWKKLTDMPKTKYNLKCNSRRSIYFSGSPDTDESGSDSSSLASSRSKKSAIGDELDRGSKGTYRLIRNEKVCSLCETVSSKPGGTDMVRCKGPCNATFHQQCVNLDEPPSGDYKCSACLSGIHECFICRLSDGIKSKCSVNLCGKFYHDKCVKSWPQVSKGRHSEKLICPRHICHMCAANADDMNDPAAKTPPFTRCLRCPTTYHTGELCIAAGVEEVSQSYHICTKHLEVPKTNTHHCNVNWCFCCSKGGSLLLCDQCPAAFHSECMNITAPEGSYVCEDCETGKFPVYGDIVWVKLGVYRWWPGQVLHPRNIPDNIENLTHKQGMFCVHFFGSDDYYWVSRGRAFHYQEGDQGSKGNASKITEQKFQKALDIALIEFRLQKERRIKQEEIRSIKGKMKPAPYTRIDTNKPVGNVKLGKLDLSNVTKCDCDPYSENPCGSDDKCINRMLLVECIREICPAGDRCNNQRFQRRQYPNVYPFKTSARGWGLKTKDFIRKGEFVIEYVGELIDDAEFRRRIVEMHDCKEENYYFLTVETDRLIDAGPKGNLARFMNHSCHPNCETQKWTVGADTRVGLFAIDDIQPESELTFNYNLECVGTEKKVCHCGASNCSGFIGVKVQKPEISGLKKTKMESGLKKKKRGGRRKPKGKDKDKDSEDDCFRCGIPGNLILCDGSMCPKGYHLHCLGLSSLPRGKWLCPWHYCDECGSRSTHRCLMCPNSFCRSHSTAKFHSESGLENLCLEHDAEELEAGSDGNNSPRSGDSCQEHDSEVLT